MHDTIEAENYHFVVERKFVWYKLYNLHVTNLFYLIINFDNFVSLFI